MTRIQVFDKAKTLEELYHFLKDQDASIIRILLSDENVVVEYKLNEDGDSNELNEPGDSNELNNVTPMELVL